jgi:hypothetical protein
MGKTAAGAANAGNDPYCSHCGYVLKGLTESSKCPECGRPIVEVLTRPQQAFLNSGRRYRSKATLFGLPVIDVAIGPKDGELRGRAKGIIAIGDVATGGLAVGGITRGVVAIGGMAFGLFAVGGLSVGLVSATGGLAVGGLAAGGGALGYFAAGGGAIGVVAQGGGALGLYTRDARNFGRPGATVDNIFDQFDWFFGPGTPGGMAFWQPTLVTFALTVAAGAVIALLAWARVISSGSGRR